jgi:hypothetical protein
MNNVLLTLIGLRLKQGINVQNFLRRYDYILGISGERSFTPIPRCLFDSPTGPEFTLAPRSGHTAYPSLSISVINQYFISTFLLNAQDTCLFCSFHFNCVDHPILSIIMLFNYCLICKFEPDDENSTFFRGLGFSVDCTGYPKREIVRKIVEEREFNGFRQAGWPHPPHST